MAQTEATELEYLRWFYSNADFGPADGDVRDILSAEFEKETGKTIPKSYRQHEDDGDE